MGVHSAPAEALSKPRAVVTILKSMVGAGILALPFAVSKVGLALALPGMVLVAVLNAVGIWRLVECKIHLKNASVEDPSIDLSNDYGLGPAGGVSAAIFGAPGAFAAGAAVLSAQVGMSICYVDIMTSTLEKRLDGVASGLLIRCVLCAMLCVLSLIRQLKDLAFLSGFALAVYAYVVFALIKWGSDNLGHDDVSAGTFLPVKWDGVGMFFGSSVFAFEGINVAQYVYDDMRIPDPLPFKKVLAQSYGICFVLYTFVGGFGYYAYGDSTREVVYMNFPSDSLDVVATEYVLCLVLLLTWVLQMYPVFGFVDSLGCWGKGGDATDSESEDASKVSSEESEDALMPASFIESWRVPVSRWCVCILSIVAAASVPDVAKVMDYIGSFSFGVIGFVLPALLHMRLCGSSMSASNWAIDVSLLVSGLMAIVLGLKSAMGG